MTLFNVFPHDAGDQLSNRNRSDEVRQLPRAGLPRYGARATCSSRVKYSASRIPIRKRMNAADAAVGGHAIDTLVNYESVKYFRQ